MADEETNNPQDTNTSQGDPSSSPSNSGDISSSQEGSAFEFSGLDNKGTSFQQGNLDFILDIPLEITIELGRTKMLINDLLKLGQGSIVEVTKAVGDTMDILANNRLIAKGDVVSMKDKYGVRITEIISPLERVESLK